MKMKELLPAQQPQIDFAKYLNSVTPRLDHSRLSMQALLACQRGGLRVPVEGDASLLIRYQRYEGAIMSIAEQANGEVWNILQIQGAKSKKSYRVDSGLQWRRAFADQVRQYVESPESDARQLRMPPTHSITNLVDAVSLEKATDGYIQVAHSLGLHWSEEMGAYVRDLTKRSVAVHV